MGAPLDPITGLTPSQERFASAVASGMNYSDAYRFAYDVAPDSLPATTWVHASQLASDDKVQTRIQQLKHAAQLHQARATSWTVDRLVSEAETQLQISREGGFKAVASGNGALELIARLTGNLADKPREVQVPITRVVVVLNRGPGSDGQRQVVEASYDVLPAATETETDTDGPEMTKLSPDGGKVP